MTQHKLSAGSQSVTLQYLCCITCADTLWQSASENNAAFADRCRSFKLLHGTVAELIEHQAQARFVKGEGGYCPTCGSGELQAITPMECGQGKAWQTVSCLACNSRWSEIYHIAKFELIPRSGG